MVGGGGVHGLTVRQDFDLNTRNLKGKEIYLTKDPLKDPESTFVREQPVSD